MMSLSDGVDELDGCSERRGTLSVEQRPNLTERYLFDQKLLHVLDESIQY